MLTANLFTNSAAALAFSPNARLLAASGFDQTIIWDVGTRKALRRLTIEGGRLAFSPASKTLAVTSIIFHMESGQVLLWDVNGNESMVLKGFAMGFDAMAFSPNSKTLAASNVDGTIRLLHRATGQELFALEGAPWDWTRFVQFDPKGASLRITFRDGVLEWTAFNTN